MWNEHGFEAWSVTIVAMAITLGFAHGPLGTWLAYGIGWTMCAVGSPGIDCSFY